MPFVRCGGAITQPTRQPVTEYVFDSELIATVRSRMPRNRGQRDVLAGIDDVLVDVIGEGDDVVGVAEPGDHLELGAREDLAGRVVRRVDDDPPRSRREGVAELVGIDPPVRLVERDVARHGAGEDRIGPVVLVVRLEDDDLVAGVQDRHHRRDHPLGRAAGDGDLRSRGRPASRDRSGSSSPRSPRGSRARPR